MAFLELIAIVVDEHDPAIALFVDVLRLELVEDSQATTDDVVVFEDIAGNRRDLLGDWIRP